MPACKFNSDEIFGKDEVNFQVDQEWAFGANVPPPTASHYKDYMLVNIIDSRYYILSSHLWEAI